MADTIETFGNGSLIQHGELNKRVYLMKLHGDDVHQALDYIHRLAEKHAYTKLFCKIPLWASPVFKANGFSMEAYIPQFYNGQTDVFFMSKYFDARREAEFERDKLLELSSVLKAQKTASVHDESDSFVIRRLDAYEAGDMAAVFASVFETYPFPVFDPEYIRQTMEEGVQYFGVFDGTKLAGLSSAEVDAEAQNAEMTDFAVLPQYRGKHLSSRLLAAMEDGMKKQSFKCLYTIARLNSMPINRLFLSGGYVYSGSLPNNTNISGKIESMNVYFKLL